jgi:phospholipid/cholesterol/gamma-HCH transport system substrate-binding protein
MVMNERVMQFRIGMFVIVAGLVLAMMLVWFGESPSLFRDHVFVKVRYVDAPGVSEGIPVRKSGIRIGEVSAIAFDERKGQPDGVIVTLSLERKYRLKAGSIPRLSRSLIGDVAIDVLPGEGPGDMKTATSPAAAPIIEGAVSPDPSKALAAATVAFEEAGNTLKSIELAATGIAKMTKSAENIDEFLDTWQTTGKNMASAAEGVDRFIKANEAEFHPTLVNLRETSKKLNDTFSPETQAALKSGIDRFSQASARLDAGLADLGPLMKDLGAPTDFLPTTHFGQTIYRMNRITADVGLLTRALSDGQGRLNTNGSLQKLVTEAELYDNFNRLSVSANAVMAGVRPILASFRQFADKIARDPAAISRGALQR